MTTNKISIGVLGKGVIGSAIYKAYKSKKFNVKFHDIKYQTTLTDIIKSNLIFVCLPTPMNKNGSCNINIINKEIKKLDSLSYKGIVCIKSTVPPGTSYNLKKKYPLLKIVNCPEFLRERSAYKDFINYGLCIIGSENRADIAFIKKIHKPFTNKFKIVSLTEAELIKYYHNTFNALRIVFANSFFKVSSSFNADYNKILNSFCERNNITDEYLKSSKNLQGFGGYCLPKDTNAFNYMVKYKKLNLRIWETIVKENKKFKKTVFPGMRK